MISGTWKGLKARTPLGGIIISFFIERAARCLTKASQIINKKNSTEITEIMDPTLANYF